MRSGAASAIRRSIAARASPVAPCATAKARSIRAISIITATTIGRASDAGVVAAGMRGAGAKHGQEDFAGKSLAGVNDMRARGTGGGRLLAHLFQIVALPEIDRDGDDVR